MDLRRLLFGSSRFRAARWLFVSGYAVFFLLGFYMSPSVSVGGALFVFLFLTPVLVAGLMSVYKGGVVLCLVIGLVPAMMISSLTLSDAVLDGSLGPPPAVALVGFVGVGLLGLFFAFSGYALAFGSRRAVRLAG